MPHHKKRTCSRNSSHPCQLVITRKPYRSDLTDEQWQRICPLLPRGAPTGRPRANEREILNGILYILVTGAQWEDLPHDIQASPKTCHRRLLEYQRRRVWQKIVASLLQEAHRRGFLNLKNAYHDGSPIKSKGGSRRRSATQENTIF